MAINGYEIVISGHIAGQFTQTVLHVAGDEPSPVNGYTRALAIATQIADTDELLATYLSALPVGFVASSVRVRRVFPAGGPTAILLASEWDIGEGQRAGEISSLQANPLVVWIGITTPAKTGRTFMPGVSETDIADMNLTAGLVAALNDFILKHSTGFSAGGDDYTGAIFRREIPQMDGILVGYVSPLIGTQRRRLRPV